MKRFAVLCFLIGCGQSIRTEQIRQDIFTIHIVGISQDEAPSKVWEEAAKACGNRGVKIISIENNLPKCGACRYRLTAVIQCTDG